MGRWGFSRPDLKEDPNVAIAVGRDLRISWKKAVEVCRAIKGMKIEEAKRFLEDVIKLKRPVPMRRYNRKVAHHPGVGPARYPVKVAKAVLEILKNLENNAKVKGLDPSNMVIIHASAHKGTKIRKYMPRAFGRSTPFFQQLVHIELAAKQL